MDELNAHFLLSKVLTEGLRDFIDKVVFSLLFLRCVHTAGMERLSQDPPNRPSHMRHQRAAGQKQRQRGVQGVGSAESVRAGRVGMSSEVKYSVERRRAS